jgi:hypothetical protein
MSVYHCERCQREKDDDRSPFRETRMPDETADVPTCFECAEDMTPEPGEAAPDYCSQYKRPHCRGHQVTDGQGDNPRPLCSACLGKHVTLYDCGGLPTFHVDGEPVESWIRQHRPTWR